MLVSSIVLGVLAGLVFRGDWRNLRRLEINWWPLALVALAARLIAVLVSLPVSVHVAAIALTAAVAIRNHAITGTLFVAAGCALNAVVIVANGGMPFDMAAATLAGAQPPRNDVLHTPLVEETSLPWLSDVVPVELFRNVYSVGDFLIAVGGFLIPFSVLRRQ